MKPRTYAQLERLEVYAYRRWAESLSVFWYRLTLACHKAVKGHRSYRGVR